MFLPGDFAGACCVAPGTEKRTIAGFVLAAPGALRTMSGMANRIGLASSTTQGTGGWQGRGLGALIWLSVVLGACGKDESHSAPVSEPDTSETGDSTQRGSDAGVDSTA